MMNTKQFLSIPVLVICFSTTSAYADFGSKQHRHKKVYKHRVYAGQNHSIYQSGSIHKRVQHKREHRRRHWARHPNVHFYSYPGSAGLYWSDRGRHSNYGFFVSPGYYGYQKPWHRGFGHRGHRHHHGCRH